MHMDFIYKKEINLIFHRLDLFNILFSNIFWGLLLPEPPRLPDRSNDERAAENQINSFNLKGKSGRRRG